MPKEKSIGAIVFRQQGNEQQFLLLHYNSGHWGFPKGHIEAGETEQETLLREVMEETSLVEIEISKGFRQYTRYFFRRGKQTIFKEVIFFLAKSSKGTVKISHEHQGFEWLPFDTALKRLTFSNTKQVLQKATTFLNKANNS